MLPVTLDKNKFSNKEKVIEEQNKKRKEERTSRSQQMLANTIVLDTMSGHQPVQQ